MAAHGRGCCSALPPADPHSKSASALLTGRRGGAFKLPRRVALLMAATPGPSGYGAQPGPKDDDSADGDAEPLAKRVRAVTRFEIIRQDRRMLFLSTRAVRKRVP